MSNKKLSKAKKEIAELKRLNFSLFLQNVELRAKNSILHSRNCILEFSNGNYEKLEKGEFLLTNENRKPRAESIKKDFKDAKITKIGE